MAVASSKKTRDRKQKTDCCKQTPKPTQINPHSELRSRSSLRFCKAEAVDQTKFYFIRTLG